LGTDECTEMKFIEKIAKSLFRHTVNYES
jgi:hypothetical protein